MSFDSLLKVLREGAEQIQKIAQKLDIDLPEKFPEELVKLNNSLDLYSASKTMIGAVVADAKGGFTLESIANLTANFNKNWDKFAIEYNELFNNSTVKEQENILETFAKTNFGANAFKTGHLIKNETPKILGGIASFKAGLKSFKGSYDTPLDAINNIKNGIDNITNSTSQIATSLNNIAKTIQGGEDADGILLLDKLSKIKDIKLLSVTSSALGIAGGGIATIDNASDLLNDIKKGDLQGALNSGKETIDNAKKTIDEIKNFGKNKFSGNKFSASQAQTSKSPTASEATTENNQSPKDKSQSSSKEQKEDEPKDEQEDNDDMQFGKSDSYVCSGATMKCTFGDKTVKLKVYPDRTVFLTGQPMANISDHISLYNISGFGKCHTTRYPATGAATAANKGKLTPMPCIPGTVKKWQNGKDDYIIKGEHALLKSSYCRCQWGGIITLINDGQTDTGPADLSRESSVSTSEMLAKTEEQFKIDPEAFLDGLQLALDAAGLAPGVGAVPDLLNASISALRGDWGAAGMSLLAAVPGIGDAATAMKFLQKGAKATKAAKKAKRCVGKNIDLSKEALMARGMSREEAIMFRRTVRNERRQFARKFYEEAGFKKTEIDSHIRGINYEKPITIEDVPPPHVFYQFQSRRNGEYRTGNYYTTDKNATPSQLGIYEKFWENGQEYPKQQRKIDDIKPQRALKSTAAGITDNFSVPGRSYETEGGAVQYFMTIH